MDVKITHLFVSKKKKKVDNLFSVKLDIAMRLDKQNKQK